MRVQYRVFRSVHTSWDNLFREAANYATEVGPERLIGISHSADYGEGVVTVWYWDTFAEELAKRFAEQGEQSPHLP